MAVLSDINDPDEAIESSPPQKVGEERELSNCGLKKKLVKRGIRYETPEVKDQVTVHCVGILEDRTMFDSSRDKNQPITFTLGQGELAAGLDHHEEQGTKSQSVATSVINDEDFSELIRAASARTLGNRIDMDFVLKQQQHQNHHVHNSKGLPNLAVLVWLEHDEENPYDYSEGSVGVSGCFWSA
ncbi:hypothetical protein PIB30_027045 [Stylosanthes scabra]|uniref:peptidylprolyl isomerase n=1 Tax=Stylosanthes scabra TaxID=79078 RepID=A0ABU6SAK0_9FABA|nr:hypothetical protein [Stylosanthes scabra]